MSSAEPEVQKKETPVPGVDITEKQDGGVIKEILREGEGDERPLKGNKVFVHYVGTLLDGSKFDASRDRGEKFSFLLGKGQVIEAWDIGVASMKKGELAKLTCRPEYAYGEDGSPPLIPPNATLVFEVELFSWEGEDLTEGNDKGVVKTLLEEGTGKAKPNDYANVTIKYSAKHEGKVIVNETTATLTLGAVEDPSIVPGVEMAIKKMKSGEKSRFHIAPAYAFGKEGNKDLGVPKNATVVYDVELVSFEKMKPVYEMDIPEKLEQAEIRKAKGTDFFKKGLTEKAVENYNTILTYLDAESLEGEEKEKRDALVLAAHLNLAACQLRLDDNLQVIEHCNKALEISKNSSKAYFRRGEAHHKRKDYELALQDYQQVVNLEPENKAAKNKILVCKKQIQDERQKEKKLYANMFSTKTQDSTKVGEK